MRRQELTNHGADNTTRLSFWDVSAVFLSGPSNRGFGLCLRQLRHLDCFSKRILEASRLVSSWKGDLQLSGRRLHYFTETAVVGTFWHFGRHHQYTIYGVFRLLPQLNLVCTHRSRTATLKVEGWKWLGVSIAGTGR